MRFLLASASPRRRELLLKAVKEFSIVPSRYNEEADGTAREIAMKNAAGKAGEVFSRYPGCLVLGADTVVELEGEILGKPRSPDHAREMLYKLSGKTHYVHTGVHLVGDGVEMSEVVTTAVTFNTLNKQFIDNYVKSGSPMDKAGAYGIQDGGIVKSYEGSYTNVVGLPMETVNAFLEKLAKEKIW